MQMRPKIIYHLRFWRKSWIRISHQRWISLAYVLFASSHSCKIPLICIGSSLTSLVPSNLPILLNKPPCTNTWIQVLNDPMRILTYAVRQALALARDEEPVDSSDKSHPQQSTSPPQASTLIPCAAPCPDARDSTGQGSEPSGHRFKRAKVEKTGGKVVESAKVDDELDHIGYSQLPSSMKKYWAQRHRLFWRFDEGIKLDEESWFSVTPEAIARQIAARCRCRVIVDGFCGAGGNAIQFAITCDRVIAIDIDPNKIKLAKANAEIYGVLDKIEFICVDFLDWISQQQPGSLDVVFLSPPWGGIDYLALQKSYYSLYDLKPINGVDLFHLARNITSNIAFYLPRHMDVMEVGRLCSLDEKVEVEEAWMGSKCKALTAYFGELVAG
ncbi:hypothetical protein O181_020389 [Austropuccinia psidii MF-1]|uniref:Trimethylguanosine synthase n=1 Tax=Austropuccinia psidii MF-1 TaxID=1389203 RepID=A0A9Q3C8U1_9BASI|nr:hypothetical protein [Austropuccinia psidii MF-1]